jgi:Smg protein
MDKIVIALNMIVDLVDNKQNINEKDITDFLIQTGFDEYEIRQTLSLLDIHNFSNTFVQRIFTEQEKRKFSIETMFFLQKLSLSGVLDLISLEEVISLALESDSYKVDIEQIKQITLAFLFEKRGLLTDYAETDDNDYIH